MFTLLVDRQPQGNDFRPVRHRGHGTGRNSRAGRYKDRSWPGAVRLETIETLVPGDPVEGVLMNGKD